LKKDPNCDILSDDQSGFFTEDQKKVVSAHIQSLCKIIDEEPDTSRLYQYRNTVKPFGIKRTQCLKVIYSLILKGDVEVTSELTPVIIDLLQVCIDHPWNSAIHKLTEDIYTSILRSNSKYPLEFKTAFLSETKLADFLMGAIPRNERNVRMGYMGSFIAIANLLDFNDLATNDEWVQFKEEGELYQSN